MSTAASVASTLIGAALVLAALRDVFHELFHPGGSGSLSRTLQRQLWKLFRWLARRRRNVLVMAGPTILVATIVAWAASLAVGWALVFWPHLPEAFRYSSPLAAAAEDGFGTALYFSLVALTTLGFGDVTPTEPLLRVLVTLEAGIGFALLTAGISWIQSVYPVLSRRRALAQRAFALHAAGATSGHRLSESDPLAAASVLAELATALATVRVDLAQTSVTYYFDEAEHAFALSAALPFIAQLSDEGIAAGRAPAVRHAALALRTTVAGYAETVRTSYLHLPERPLREILAAHAADHHRAPYPG